VMLIGVGLSLDNTRAVVEGLFSAGGDFERTPKHGVLDGRPLARARRYRAAQGAWPWARTLLVAYFTMGLGLALREGRWPFLPILALFWMGHATMAAWEWSEARRARPALPPRAARSSRPATTSA